MTNYAHEVIFAIVNSGYAEDVMDAARENGARGGTILNGRGVIDENAAAFFNIALNADKEILMLVVETELRDTILNAIYKALDMSRKAKGIAFSRLWDWFPVCLPKNPGKADKTASASPMRLRKRFFGLRRNTC